MDFFRRVTCEERSALCAELLASSAFAMEYWQNGGEPEVLDRLNPEVREIVEKIVSGQCGKLPRGRARRASLANLERNAFAFRRTAKAVRSA